MSPQQTKMATEMIAEYDSRLAKVQKTYAVARTAFEKKKKELGKTAFAELQQALFAPAQAKPKGTPLFDIGRDVSDKNFANILSPLRGELLSAERELKALQDGREAFVEQATQMAAAQKFLFQTVADNATQANIQSGIDALRQIADGKDEVRDAMQRPELVEYGGTSGITFYWGDEGNINKNFKGGYGFAKIVA
jgi:hypothetical protein